MRIAMRIAEIIQLAWQNIGYYRYFSSSAVTDIDNRFALPGDKELTEEQVQAIDEFWGKYKFAYPKINYKSFKVFMNRCGEFSVYHCPPGIRNKCMHRAFFDTNYFFSFQNKGLLQKLYTVKQPRTIVRRMKGIYFDEDYNKISLREAISICCNAVKNGSELVIKPSGKGGGQGVLFIGVADREEILKMIRSQGSAALVIQEVIKQSKDMSRFNVESVNTLRVTTLLYKGEVHVLAALVRVGASGNRVDNWCAGGSLVGINIETGCCLSWALTNDNRKISVLPSGLDLAAEPFQIPNIQAVWELVKKAHYQIPYIKMISWDIAIDENHEPVMIENNFAGMYQIHEAVTGPIFGKLTEEILDEYLLKRFYFEKATLNYDYREYHDHVFISKYVGTKKIVTVPAEIGGKPVTVIGDNCFSEQKQITKIVLPDTVTRISIYAFAGCTNLKEIVYPKGYKNQ